jgi:hypothetical protein
MAQNSKQPHTAKRRKGHKNLRAFRNKLTGKYAKQRLRTEANKKRRRERFEKMVADSRRRKGKV